MKIEALRIYAVKIPLTEEFATALGKSTYFSGVITELITDEGLVGYGAGSPSPRITGDTLETTMSAFYRLAKLIIGKDPLEYREILRSVERALIGNPAAKAAIDIALFDVVTKYYRVPLRKLLGNGSKESFETSVTISLSERKENMIRKAKDLVESGVTILKIKIGLEPLKDIDIVKSIRREVGSDIQIRIDANQAYTPKQAIKVLRALENEEIEFCEQPVYWRDLDGLKFVRMNTEIPIMADEAVHTPWDALEIIKRDAADMINIKIMKAGGIFNSMLIADICKTYGIPCQIGCMSETSLSIAAGVQLAIAMKGIKYSDLDGHLILREDPFKGLVFKNSKNFISNNAGIGVELDRAVLERYVVAKLEFKK